MSNYLLLRDNKQSGPYSMEELRSKGLKPYDLVWIDGKSAAWRYPSEVDELKSFAPVVEEQPFDRFFRKPSSVSASTEAAVAVNENKSTVSPVVTPQPTHQDAGSAAASAPGRKIIYVTMPGNNKNLKEEKVREERVREERGREERIQEETVPDQRIRSEKIMEEEKVAIFPGLQIPYKGNIEEDFSQHTGVADQRFVEKRPQFGRFMSGKRTRPFVIALSVVALLAAGILIGLSLNGHFRGLDRNAASTEELAADHPASPVPVYTPVANNSMQKTDKAGNLSNPIISDPASSRALNIAGEISKKKTSSAKEKLIAIQQQKMAAGANSAKDSAALAMLIQPRRETPQKAGDPLDREAIKNSVVSQVSVSSNKYNTGTFGGISELQLTVSNKSVYPLDLVVVEVQYIQANKKLYKTESLYFRGIGAGSALMQEAPRSSRGVKVQYRVILINSKELGLSYSGI